MLRAYIEIPIDLLIFSLKQAFLRHRWSFDHDLECIEKNETAEAKLIQKGYTCLPHLF
jgi:hypothetical protein